MNNEVRSASKGVVQTAKQKQIAFSRIEFMFWFTLGTWSFFVPLLQASGMDSAMVGVVLSANSVMGIISPPIWGTLSDKIQSVKKVFLVLFILTTASVVSLPFFAGIMVGGLSMAAIMIPVATFFLMPLQGLMDTWLVTVVGTEKTLDYGRIRLFGSIGYAVIGVINTMLVQATGLHTVFYTFAVLAVPTFILAKRQPNIEPVESLERVAAGESGGGLMNFYFVTWLIFMFMMIIPANNAGSFTVYLIEAVNGDSASIGMVSGLRALLEVVFMLLGATMMKKYSIKSMITIAAVIYIIEHNIYWICTATWQVTAAQMLSGLAYGMLLNCYIRYTALMAPVGMEARAQTFTLSALQFSAVCSNLLGGKAIALFGVHTYYSICSGIIAFAILFFAGTILFGEKVLKKQRPLGARKPLPAKRAD